MRSVPFEKRRMEIRVSMQQQSTAAWRRSVETQRKEVGRFFSLLPRRGKVGVSERERNVSGEAMWVVRAISLVQVGALSAARQAL